VQPSDFKRWRKSLHLSQKEAADALGLKRRVVQYYEKGERDGDKVVIPKYVRLACYALAQGVEDYDGPEILDENGEAVVHLPAKPHKHDVKSDLKQVDKAAKKSDKKRELEKAKEAKQKEAEEREAREREAKEAKERAKKK